MKSYKVTSNSWLRNEVSSPQVNLPFIFIKSWPDTVHINLSSGRQKTLFVSYTIPSPSTNPTASSFRFENSLTFLSSKANPLGSAVKKKSAVRKATIRIYVDGKQNSHLCKSCALCLWSVVCWFSSLQTIKEQQTKHDTLIYSFHSFSHSLTSFFSVHRFFLQAKQTEEEETTGDGGEKKLLCVHNYKELWSLARVIWAPIIS